MSLGTWLKKVFGMNQTTDKYHPFPTNSPLQLDTTYIGLVKLLTGEDV